MEQKNVPKHLRSHRVTSAADVDLGTLTPDSTAQPILGTGLPGFEPTTLAEVLDRDEPTMRTIDIQIGLACSIRQIRQAAGMSQAALAKKLGVSRARILELKRVGAQPTLDRLIPAFFAVGGTTGFLKLCGVPTGR